MIPGVNDRAQCSAPLPPPPLWVVETTKTWTGWPAACRPPAVGPSWRRRCAGCRRRCRRRGEAAGGGREARGIPGRGEENEYRGQKVQGGVEVDEAQHGREEEEGGSVGGWAAGPGGGGRARAWWATAMAGDWTTALRMPPRCVSEGGLSSRHLSIYP
jgi:hypothetical protein